MGGDVRGGGEAVASGALHRDHRGRSSRMAHSIVPSGGADNGRSLRALMQLLHE